MWACAEYAVPPAYLQSAEKEIQDNVKRMQAHPSIVLWAGNNEDEHDMSQGQVEWGMCTVVSGSIV